MLIKQTTEKLFFLISPPKHILLDIRKFKNEVHTIIGHSFESYHSIGHITLSIDTANPNLILKEMERVAQSIAPFPIVIKNFITFKHGIKRSLVLNIADKHPFKMY
jgi:2'-5' RNA ligase